MRWSANNMFWGRPLRSIFALFDGKLLEFKYEHLKTPDRIIIEDGYESSSFKIKSFKEYSLKLKANNIHIDQDERKNIILKKFREKCKSKNLQEIFDDQTLSEVVNLVDNPNILFISFEKEFLKIPKEIIISTLSLITSGGLIPIVNEVGVLGDGSPRNWYKGICAFCACQSHKAVSRAA